MAGNGGKGIQRGGSRGRRSAGGVREVDGAAGGESDNGVGVAAVPALGGNPAQEPKDTEANRKPEADGNR